jgi:hypothetical protein
LEPSGFGVSGLDFRPSPLSRLCGGLRLRPRLGGGVVGSTRARTLASPLNLPNNPGRGSVTVTNSASDSSTPSMSRAASRASSIVLPVVSTHSICQRAFRGLLSLARGGAAFCLSSSSLPDVESLSVLPFEEDPRRADGLWGRPLPAAGGFGRPLVEPFELGAGLPGGAFGLGVVPFGFTGGLTSFVIASIDPLRST